jgi:Sec-independent protein translocase protein TatA
MDILGIGGWEFIAILVIMLVVAGPKRMIQWSYTLGQYVARLRQLWTEAAAMLQQELDQAGVDVKVPQQIPTRQSLSHELSRTFNHLAKPVQQPIETVQKEIEQTVRMSVSDSEIEETQANTPALMPADGSSSHYGT